MFLREVVTGQRTGNPVRYAQIVESYRDDAGKARHRVLLPLGRVDRLDRDQVQRLVVGLARYLETGTVPEGGRIGQVREFGVGYLAAALWQQLALPAFFRTQLKARKYEAPVERALFAMVAHRLVDPASKRACAEWLDQDAWLPGCRGVRLQHLDRAMDFLDACHEPLEAALDLHRRTLFDRVEVVYDDTTSTYFECDDPGDEPEQDGLRQRGYSRDLRPDRRQVVVGLAVDQHGLPIASDVYRGDTNDPLTVVPMLTRLRALGLTRVVWIADRGMASDLNLAAVRTAQMHYVVGVRLRAVEDLRAAITADPAPYRHAAEGLQVKEVRLGDHRYVVCFAPASAARDLELRTGAIARMRPVVERVNAGDDAAALTGHGLYRRLVTRGPDGAFHLDKAKLEREAQCDGTFVLDVSDPTMTAEQAALAYKGLLRVEQSFRGLKQSVDLRPVDHRLDARIRAHVTLCLLAYMLERVVEVRTGTPFAHLHRHLTRVRAVELTFDKQTVWETSKAAPELKAALTKLKVAVPPRVLIPDTV
ncbi:MAG: IS1634 family transposase [Acidimicrobiales bacterium]